MEALHFFNSLQKEMDAVSNFHSKDKKIIKNKKSNEFFETQLEMKKLIKLLRLKKTKLHIVK